MRLNNVWYENLNKDTVNCGIGVDKPQNVLWRSKSLPLPSTDNPDEIPDGYICITLFLQTSNNEASSNVVNGFISHDTISTKRTLIATKQMRKLHQCLLPKTR